MLSKALHVRKQVLGRVHCEIGAQVTCVRRTSATATLIEQDYPVGTRIEVAAHSSRTPRARATVEDNSGLSVWMTADLPVYAVSVADIKHAVLERLDFWVQYCQIILFPKQFLQIGLTPGVRGSPHKITSGTTKKHTRWAVHSTPVLGGIRILQEVVIGFNQVTITCGRWNTGAETDPLLREKRGDATVEPVDF